MECRSRRICGQICPTPTTPISIPDAMTAICARERTSFNRIRPAALALKLVTLYKITGNRKYLYAATGIADSLAAHIRPGDADNSPWPFRVNALTGEVHRATTKDGKPISASYTTNWSPSLRLFN